MCDDCGGSGLLHSSGCTAYPGRLYEGMPCRFGCKSVRCEACKGGGWTGEEERTRELRNDKVGLQALEIECPRCEVPKGKPCQSSDGAIREDPHIIRLRRAREGKPAEEVDTSGR